MFTVPEVSQTLRVLGKTLRRKIIAGELEALHWNELGF